MSDIRLKNAMQQLRNTSVIDRSVVKKHRNQAGEAWSVDCQFDLPADKVAIQRYMNSELDLYNQIISTFNPTSRTSPETFAAFTENHIALFGLLAEHGYNICKIRPNNIPAELSAFETLIKDGSISERMKLLMESASGNYAVAAATKKAMAREILKFYTEDAKVRLQKLPSRMLGEQSYTVAPKSLSKQDSLSKRHLQIHRTDVSVQYSDDDNSTLIRTPYNRGTIKVQGVDLTDRKSWNILIIHQTPNIVATSKTPWVLDFRGVKQDYLVEYLDDPNSRAGVFWQAKVGQGRK